jgi:hypothetical protein
LQEKGLTDPQRQSQHAATALSDNQTAAAKKIAKLQISDRYRPPLQILIAAVLIQIVAR